MLNSIKNSFIIWAIILLGSPLAVASTTPYFDLSVLGDGYMMSTADHYNNGQLHGRFKLMSEWDESKVFFELGAGGLVGDDVESYVILPQVYYMRQLENSKLTVGRSVRNYSTLDEYWLLGDVQPVFRWDAVHPELQGLTGLFFDYAVTKNFEINLFGSYTFVPTQGPSFSVTDGKVTSSNPWFTRPVDALELDSGDSYDLQYTVDVPNVSDVVLNPSWGIGFTAKSDDESLWMRANYFIKQKNDLALPFDGAISPGTKTGSLKVLPQVAEHHLTTLDVGYRSDKYSATVSGIYESDITFDVNEPSWIYPVFSDQYKVGLNLMARLTAAHTLEFGLLRTFHNTVGVNGLPGSGNIEIYSYRNQYDNAVDLRWSSVFIPESYGFLFKTKARYAYDYEVNTSLVSFEGSYMPVEGISLFALADFFGGKKEVGKAYNNLLVNYLNRDRAQVGVRYVF